MGVLFAYRLLVAIGVDETDEVVACSTFASITLFVDAVAAFPTRCFCAIVRMRAAVIQVVGFASTSEEMLCIAAFGFAIHLCARSCFVIANGIVATHFELIPFPSYAFGKHVVVAFPSAVGAFRRARRVRWHFFRRDRIATTRGEEHRRSERDPIQFAILHDVTPLLFYKIIQTICAKNIKPYNSQ